VTLYDTTRLDSLGWTTYSSGLQTDRLGVNLLESIIKSIILSYVGYLLRSSLILLEFFLYIPLDTANEETYLCGRTVGQAKNITIIQVSSETAELGSQQL